MPFDFARKADLKFVSRQAKCLGFAALLLFVGCESLQTAVANGDTRTISFHNLHTGEDLTVTFKRDGRYDEAALQKINWILRDWRRNEPTKMDPQLIDLVWEAQREAGGKVPIQIVCGYRAPATNAMLRARSRGVAQFSQHMLGKAMDFFLADVPLAKLREVGLRLQRGGVGFYPTSGSPFVHLDTGNVRHWPKMTRDQLAKVFPDGKTVHVPADGRPMPGYQLALAEIKARGERNVNSISMASAGQNSAMADGASVKRFFAKLFGKKDESGDDEETTTAAAKPVQTETVKVAAAEPVPQAAHSAPATQAANIPLPRPRPASEIAALEQQMQQQVQLAALGDRVALPAEITGAPQEGLALGYAPDSIFSPRAIADAPAAARLPAPRRASVPVANPEFTASIPAAPKASRGTTASAASVASTIFDFYDGAAYAPAMLLDSRSMQWVGKLHQQNPAIAMELATPVRMTLDARFSLVPEQPALMRFASTAAGAEPAVFFGRAAMLNRTARAN
ncbi:MAG TPA: DUF882 domain-containing protein [Xanthobacteraceae bacterium]|nr:DUF882 domain-containing protein [Xanthobacteraceae bacterium]